MGEPKLLLPWRDTTVIGWIIRQWQQLGAQQMAAVCRADDSPLHAELDRLQHPRADRIINPDPSRGMFSSIQCAANWNGWPPALTHFAIALGDQPQLATETLTAIIESATHSPSRICQPLHTGRAQHPILLPRVIFGELKNTAHHTMKEFLAARKDELNLVEINDSGVAMDIDTPEDYRAVVERFGGKGD